MKRPHIGRWVIVFLALIGCLTACSDKPVNETPPVVGVWQGHNTMNDLLGFETAYTLDQTIVYTIRADGTFSATASISDAAIDTFLDNVLAESGKTCEEMFGQNRQTVINEIHTVADRSIDGGTYAVSGSAVAFSYNGETFSATLSGDSLTVTGEDGSYTCQKISSPS